ncbi:MAG: VWA domain-containing protein [Gammaproteobacteria bacterium]|nr:VWA domain-containing protein [Gammaproteobacteria bacterium]MDP2140816.1 VWA domain-containing protein [Gammaproteobacteria bacterium]MDP2347562.1 VWA domain-containing protein [Gammaproteobacteria bacterium]
MNFILDQHYLDAIQDGRFSFAYGLNPFLALLIAAALVAAVWFSYQKTTRALTPGWKAILITLRSLVLILLFVCLLRPVVTTEQVVPQATYLAVLVDDSQSMSITDLPGGQSRAVGVSNLLFGGSGILEPLGESFQVRTFRFDKNTQRVTEAGNLTAAGTASAIDQALQYVDDQLSGLALGGIVLFSDGADNDGTDPVARAQGFGVRQIPIFTVGVGQENIPQDVGIVDVSAAKTVLEGSVFNVDVALSNRGYEGRQVELSIMDGDTVVTTERVVLGPDNSTRRVSLELTPERQEAIVYRLQVAEQDGEIVLQNNTYSFLVDNSERPALDILYVDGHPRNEYKFIRRAVEGDTSLRLATYLQTGPGKFYRQGIKTPLELSGGFPSTVEELYQYEAIILGDIGKDFFTPTQLTMMQDFVAERGGGLLVAGMMEDLFVDTVIADILPVTLISSNLLPQHLQGGITRGSHPTGELFRPQLSNAGEYSELLRLHSEDAENLRLWRAMPDLQGVYVTGRAKPGATVLMEHPLLQYQNQLLPVMATQRYGSGRSMSITSASTWRWQMMMPVADQSHERVWRQILRWLSVSALERVSVNFDREFYHVGDQVNVTATVRDINYKPDNGASVWIHMEDPEGNAVDTAMEWDIDEDGVYRASFEAQSEGVFKMLVDVASAAGESNRSDTEKNTAFVVTPSLREYSAAGRDTGLLERIAAASGGRYYNLDQTGQLATDITYTPNAYSREVQEDLWDTPFLLFLLILLLCADWIARRFKGLS